MGITHAFISAKSDGSDPTEVQPSHWNADHVVDIEGAWTSEIVKPSDETVATSTVNITDAHLQLPVTADSIWRIELELLYSGTSGTGDFKFVLNVSSGLMFGVYRYMGSENSTDGVAVVTGTRMAGTTVTGSLIFGTDASSTIRMVFLETMVRFNSAATFRIQWSQNSASGSTTVKAGSVLRGRRII